MRGGNTLQKQTTLVRVLSLLRDVLQEVCVYDSEPGK
jgi:hypothetical protein